MEEMKKKLKRNSIIWAGTVCLAILTGVYMLFQILNKESMPAVYGEVDFSTGMMDGFRIGLIMGLGILGLVNIIHNIRIIRDEKKIQLYYNQLKDERMQAIRSKAGIPMILFTSLMILAAAIIAGNYSTPVFLTLLITAMVQLSISVAVKLYYMRTM